MNALARWPEAQGEGRPARAKHRGGALEVIPIQLRYKLWIERKGHVVVGEGLHELLMRVEQTGSISRAAAAMDLAYREAWGRLRAAESAFGAPLLERHTGGPGGGGTSLTPAARELVARFAAIEAELADCIARLQDKHLTDL